MKILRKIEIVVIFMPILFARSMLSFVQYEMKIIRGYAFPWEMKILLMVEIVIFMLLVFGQSRCLSVGLF